MSQELSATQGEALSAYFLSRAAGERTAALAFGHIVADLSSFAGSNEFTKLGRSAQQDEQRHAEVCQRLAQMYSPAPLPQALPRSTRPATLPDASPEEHRVLRTVFGCCFGETIAVQWLLDAHSACTDPAVRRHNRAHIADEVKHSRIGWRFLASDLLSQRDKQLIASYVPLMARWSRKLWHPDGEPTHNDLQAFGVPTPESTRTSVEKALTEVIFPGLEHHGVPVADA